MRIVIAGAGDVGFHLAELLAIENQDIILIDTDEEALQYATTHLDVMSVKGDVTSISVLKNANIAEANLFIACTTRENTNLMSCILAKKLGAQKTIARIDKFEYLEEEHRLNFVSLGVDNLISPRYLASKEIERLILRCSASDLFDFEDGKLSVLGFTAYRDAYNVLGKPVSFLNSSDPDFPVKVVAILRNGKTFIPTPDTTILVGDHIYISTSSQDFERLNEFIGGRSLKDIKRIMIIGDSPLAMATAKLLEEKYAVSLISRDEKACKYYLEHLDNTLIINAETNNVEVLREEGLESMDAFIALTSSSSTNIISSLTAENLGVYKTIAHVENSAYIPISQNIGVDTLINKKLIAANYIFRFVRKGKVEAIASLHGVNAEMIEFEIHKKNRVVQNTLGNLRLPATAVVIGIIRSEQTIIPDESFQLAVGDKVVVFTLHESIKKVEAIFR